MLIVSLTLFVIGVYLVLLSGKISGRAIEGESFLTDEGLLKIIKYIFTHNPFYGYQKDIRILVYGLLGLIFMIIGGFGFLYFVILFYLDFSR